MSKRGLARKSVLAKPELRVTRDRQIWDLFLRNTPPYLIARELGFSVSEVKERIDVCYKESCEDLGNMVKYQREADLNMISSIIRVHSETALKTSIPDVKVSKDGEPYILQDYDTPLKSAQLVLTALRDRARVMGYDAGSESTQKTGNSPWLGVWLHQERAPKEKDGRAPLELEEIEFFCDAENPGNKT